METEEQFKQRVQKFIKRLQDFLYKDSLHQNYETKNEQKIILICSHSSIIEELYNQLCGKDLKQELKHEINFGEIVTLEKIFSYE